jgi:MOSC domain-containing protein YiiM
MRKKLPDLDHGMFAENIVTREIDLSCKVVGNSLSVGDRVVLEVTHIGNAIMQGVPYRAQRASASCRRKDYSAGS